MPSHPTLRTGEARGANGMANHGGLLVRLLRSLLLGLGPLLAGSAVGLVTQGGGSRWYRRLAKPPWNPPPVVFGPVWTVLYLLMGLAAVLVDRERDRGTTTVATPALRLFGAQLVL